VRFVQPKTRNREKAGKGNFDNWISNVGWNP